MNEEENKVEFSEINDSVTESENNDSQNSKNKRKKGRTKKKYKSLRGRVIRGSILVALLTIIPIVVVVMLTVSDDYIDIYTEKNEKSINMIESIVKNYEDDIFRGYRTGEKGDNYKIIQNSLNSIVDNSDINSIYIVVPEEENYFVYSCSDDFLKLSFGDRFSKKDFIRDNGLKAEEVHSNDASLSRLPTMTREDLYTLVEQGVPNAKDFVFLVGKQRFIKEDEGDLEAAIFVYAGIFDVVESLVRLGAAIVFTSFWVVILVVLLVVLVTVKGVANPLNRMARAADELMADPDGDMSPRERFGRHLFEKIKVKNKDEIGYLYKNLTQMENALGIYLNQLMEVTSEKERIGAELDVATKIQADMLPNIFPAFPDRKEFDLYALMEPAKEVGGDFYDFFLIDDDHLGAVMADVSGKGVPAALFMVISKTMIKNTALQGCSPAKVLTDVNNALCEGNKSRMFVTVWFAIIELSTGKGIAANGGHEHPAIKRADGEFELIKYKHGPVLGVIPKIQYAEHEFEMAPGDRLFVYTDGVTEAINEEEVQFGNDRLEQGLNRHAHENADKLCVDLRSDIAAFVGEAEQFDDITMLCIDYFGNEDVKA
ncbi:MAG: SpoIIE family protein phosphatase [Lachnospiraceae bacterium]|nr:SpoIIE family protein phosphatase [Lachnospiraceae bacterium]